MADTTSSSLSNPNPNPIPESDPTTTNKDKEVEVDDENEDGDEDAQEQEEEEEEKERAKHVLGRLSSGPVPLRVHDVIIKGNARTKESLIEAEVAELLRSPSTVQDLIRAANVANARLRRLDVFDSVSITLDAGPPELPGTTNVVVEVVEAANPVTGNFGVFSKPEARSWSLEGSLKLKNFFGYGDIWDASGAYGFDQTSEIGFGVAVPRFKGIPTPLTARASLSTQDWLKFSSYKERLLGLSFGLFSTINHDLSYNLTWRNLTDPSRMASQSVRRQLGHSLLSALKYTFKLDRRDSSLRPTRGYAFLSSSQIGGLWESRGLRFFRQEFDLRGAMSLGFYNCALNAGIAAGVTVPWSNGLFNSSSPIPDRLYLGGHCSPVCSLGVLSSLLGFRTRGIGPTEPRRSFRNQSDKDEPPASPGRDYLGGDLAVSTFVDLSFDLPLKLFRDAGIHGHAFLTAGNLAKLSEGEYKNFSFSEFVRSFRRSAGVGIVLPTQFFRVEINYCYILKQFEHDRGKTGVQFSFSSPL